MGRMSKTHLHRIKYLCACIIYFFDLYEIETPSAIAELLTEVNETLALKEKAK